MRKIAFSLVLLAALCLGTQAEAALKFKKGVKVSSVKPGQCLEMPYITWGGDMALFHANGGKKTAPGSIMSQLGVCLDLRAGDNFIEQVERAQRGETPFVRGTMRMLSLAGETMAADRRTSLQVVYQMTYSQGDYCVARKGIDKLGQLRGKKIGIQDPGPHNGLLSDMLDTAGLGVNDVRVMRYAELSGKGSAVEAFQKGQLDVACMITPDMIAVTGGADKVGTGAEGTVSGAHVLLGTPQLSRSIADVLAVRSDWAAANSGVLQKIAVGYLKGVEQLVKLKKAYEQTGRSPEYDKVLRMAQDRFGKQLFPTPDDAHALLSDATFVGHPGNVHFFSAGQDDPVGFAAFAKRGAALAVKLGHARKKVEIVANGMAWDAKIFSQHLTNLSAERAPRFDEKKVQAEVEGLDAKGLDERTLYKFKVPFRPDQTSFPESKYASDFAKVVRLMRQYGGAVIVVEGHVDPTIFLSRVVRAGKANGVLRCADGSKPCKQYLLQGQALDIMNTERLADLVDRGSFSHPQHDPMGILRQARNTSLQRAKAVRRGILEYANKRGLELDETQLTFTGSGVRSPVVIVRSKRDKAKMGQNMRAEVRIVVVSAEAVKDDDFDF